VSGPRIIETVEELNGQTEVWRQAGDTVALVPTMGSLHEGHLALVHRAKDVADHVVVSIFVNPLQFGPDEDFDTYPRQLSKDQEFLAPSGVEVIFAPRIDDVYPESATPRSSLSAGLVGEVFEGASRPGHFDGVVTVVKRLCDIVQPDSAVFGAKDAQQLCVIRQMVDREKVPVTLHEVDTVRSDDGIALSSRNVYLSQAERDNARAIPRALQAASRAHSIPEALQAATEVLDAQPGIDVDYVDVVDKETFQVTRSATKSLMILAVQVGSTRLIDNQVLEFHQ
jgi:pantoate--beta-alanine ligase